MLTLAMVLRGSVLWFLPLLASACTSPSASFFTLQLASASGQNPFSDAANGTVTLDITEAAMTRAVSGSVANGVVQLSLPISSYESVTEFAVRAELDGGRVLVGSVGPFVPAGYGFARALMGTRASCAQLSSFSLGGATQRFGIARFGSNLVLMGGTSIDGDTRQVLFGNTVQLSASEAALTAGGALTRAPGAGRLFGLSDNELLFIGEQRSFRYAPSASTMRDIDLVLYDGAGVESGATQLASGEVVVVGGISEGSRSTRYARVSTLAEVSGGAMRHARASAAVAELSNGMVLVGGGNVDGALFEILGDGPEISGLNDTAISRGKVFADPGRPIAYFVRENGLNTYRVDCRQAPCVASLSASQTARVDGATAVRLGSRSFLIGGVEGSAPTANVREMVFSEDSMTIVSTQTLTTPRDTPYVLALTPNTLLVLGGRGAESMLESAEICWM